MLQNTVKKAQKTTFNIFQHFSTVYLYLTAFENSRSNQIGYSDQFVCFTGLLNDFKAQKIKLTAHGGESKKPNGTAASFAD